MLLVFGGACVVGLGVGVRVVVGVCVVGASVVVCCGLLWVDVGCCCCLLSIVICCAF